MFSVGSGDVSSGTKCVEMGAEKDSERIEVNTKCFVIGFEVFRQDDRARESKSNREKCRLVAERKYGEMVVKSNRIVGLNSQ